MMAAGATHRRMAGTLQQLQWPEGATTRLVKEVAAAMLRAVPERMSAQTRGLAAWRGVVQGAPQWRGSPRSASTGHPTTAGAATAAPTSGASDSERSGSDTYFSDDSDERNDAPSPVDRDDGSGAAAATGTGAISEPLPPVTLTRSTVVRFPVGDLRDAPSDDEESS